MIEKQFVSVILERIIVSIFQTLKMYFFYYRVSLAGQIIIGFEKTQTLQDDAVVKVLAN